MTPTLSPRAHAYLHGLSDDHRAQVLGMAWDALDANNSVGLLACEIVAMEFAVVFDIWARARGRQQVRF